MALRKTAVAGMSGMAVAYGVQQKRRTEAAATSGKFFQFYNKNRFFGVTLFEN